MAVHWAAVAAVVAAVIIALLAVIFIPPLLTDRPAGNPSANAPSPPEDTAPVERSPSQAVSAIAGAEPETRADDSESLEELLTSGSLPGSPEEAMERLLSLWDIDYDSNRGNGCAQARSENLRCLWQRGSFGVLRQLDRPAVLTLIAHSGQTYEAVLVSLSGSEAQLAFGDGDAHL